MYNDTLILPVGLPIEQDPPVFDTELIHRQLESLKLLETSIRHEIDDIKKNRHHDMEKLKAEAEEGIKPGYPH